MSHPPWTLFCPRSGLTPVEGRPICPVIMARFAIVFTSSVPFARSVIPMPYRMEDAPRGPERPPQPFNPLRPLGDEGPVVPAVGHDRVEHPQVQGVVGAGFGA